MITEKNINRLNTLLPTVEEGTFTDFINDLQLLANKSIFGKKEPEQYTPDAYRAVRFVMLHSFYGLGHYYVKHQIAAYGVVENKYFFTPTRQLEPHEITILEMNRQAAVAALENELAQTEALLKKLRETNLTVVREEEEKRDEEASTVSSFDQWGEL